MRQLLNTLFVTSEDVYLSLDGENVVANRGGEAVARYPLHTLQSIVSFSYAGLSPALMGECAKRGIGVALCSPRGQAGNRVGVLYPERAIPCPRLRTNAGQCAVAADAVSGRRRSL